MKARERPSVMLRSDPGVAAPSLRAHATGQATPPASWSASVYEKYQSPERPDGRYVKIDRP